MSDDLSICAVCHGLIENGVCDNEHPRNQQERVEMNMKNWISQYYAQKENNNE